MLKGHAKRSGRRAATLEPAEQQNRGTSGYRCIAAADLPEGQGQLVGTALTTGEGEGCV